MNNPTLNTPGQRLKYVREKLLRLSRADLFKKHGLSPDTLAAWENEKLIISEKGIDRCIGIYSAEGIIVSREWLLTGEGLSPNFSFDLNRYFKSLPTQESDEKVDDTIFLAKEIDFFRSLSPNSITALISTNDMLPIYSCGDHVGGRLRYGKEVESCIGKNCIIKTKDGSLFVRRLVKNPRGKGYNLVCLNPEWDGTLEPVMFSIEVECAAPIIWHRRADH